MATIKFDYILCILPINATRFLVNFFEDQPNLHFTIIES